MAAVPLWQRRLPLPTRTLTQEEATNQTLQANVFFADQLIFNNQTLLSSLTQVFHGVHYEAGEDLEVRGEPATLIIIENGTAHVVHNTEDDKFHYKEGYQHGDSYGAVLPCLRGAPALW